MFKSIRADKRKRISSLIAAQHSHTGDVAGVGGWHTISRDVLQPHGLGHMLQLSAPLYRAD